MIRPPPRSTLFPNTPLFRSRQRATELHLVRHRWIAQRAGFAGEFLQQKTAFGDEAGPAVGEVRMQQCFEAEPDRKSTRLNSSHSQISYAVFCLKKKKQT